MGGAAREQKTDAQVSAGGINRKVHLTQKTFAQERLGSKEQHKPS